jgi:hypothetical protein
MMEHNHNGNDITGAKIGDSFRRNSYKMRSQCLVKLDAEGIDLVKNFGNLSSDNIMAKAESIL